MNIVIVSAEIHYNGHVFRTSEASEAAACQWITRMLAALFAERPLQAGDQLDIRRVS